MLPCDPRATRGWYQPQLLETFLSSYQDTPLLHPNPTQISTRNLSEEEKPAHKGLMTMQMRPEDELAKILLPAWVVLEALVTASCPSPFRPRNKPPTWMPKPPEATGPRQPPASQPPPSTQPPSWVLEDEDLKMLLQLEIKLRHYKEVEGLGGGSPGTQRCPREGRDMAPRKATALHRQHVAMWVTR